MKYSIKVISCIIILGFLFSCKKNQQAPAVTNPIQPPIIAKGYFFKNTEWSGTSHGYSQQYDRPTCLKFRGDTAFTLYGLLYNKTATVFNLLDSLRGKITKVDSTADGRILINVTFALSGDQQVWSITNKNSMIGASLAPSVNSFEPRVELCPTTIASIASSTWCGKVVPDTDPKFGIYMVPDLSTISFSTPYEIFSRNGHIITDTRLNVFHIAWNQQGSMISFFGYDETVDLIIPYWGVLSAKGDVIFVDSRSGSARLPNYVQTTNRYGFAGVTPVIYKQ